MEKELEDETVSHRKWCCSECGFILWKEIHEYASGQRITFGNSHLCTFSPPLVFLTQIKLNDL